MTAPVDVEQLPEEGSWLTAKPMTAPRPQSLDQSRPLEHLLHERVGIFEAVFPDEDRVEVAHVEPSVAALVLAKDRRHHASRHPARRGPAASIEKPVGASALHPFPPPPHRPGRDPHEIRCLDPAQLTRHGS